ncbi:hypothetical protein MRX96_024738 [Rhipicephalus microplus]
MRRRGARNANHICHASHGLRLRSTLVVGGRRLAKRRPLRTLEALNFLTAAFKQSSRPLSQQSLRIEKTLEHAQMRATSTCSRCPVSPFAEVRRGQVTGLSLTLESGRENPFLESDRRQPPITQAFLATALNPAR